MADPDSRVLLLILPRCMIHQALSLDVVSESDTVMMFSFELRRYLDPGSNEDHVDLLGELLSQFKLVYIIVQVEAMLPNPDNI